MLKTGGWEGFRRFVVSRKVIESDLITSFYLEPEDKGHCLSFFPAST